MLGLVLFYSAVPICMKLERVAKNSALESSKRFQLSFEDSLEVFTQYLKDKHTVLQNMLCTVLFVFF